MQFHKVTAISVELVPWKGWTATFVPATGTSYTLSSLPVGTTIALIGKGSLELSKWNTTIWTIEYVPAPYYDVSSFSISRWWTSIQITSSPLELLEWDVINITFKETSIEISFYNDETWQWYDAPSWWTVLNTITLSQWYYIINWMYQMNKYWYLDVTDTSTEKHIQWCFIPKGWWNYTWLKINWETIKFPYAFWKSDLMIAASTEPYWVFLESNEYWHWEDKKGNTIDYCELYNTSGDQMEFEIDYTTWKAKIFDVVNTNTIYFVPEDHCEITDVILNYYNHMPYKSATNVKLGDTLVWVAVIESPFELMNSSTLNALGNNLISGVPCLKIDNLNDVIPTPNTWGMKYYPMDYETHYYMWFMLNQRYENSSFAIIAFDDNWVIIDSKCYDYNDNPFWMTRSDLMRQWCNWAPYSGKFDYSIFLQQWIRFCSTSGVVEEIRKNLNL